VSPAGQAGQFAAEVAKLKSEGLSPAVLSQIIQAGPGQGLPVARGIREGGKPAIAELNDLHQQISLPEGGPPRRTSTPACTCPPCWGGLCPPPSCPVHGQTEIMRVTC
jgi:hypothetical protein